MAKAIQAASAPALRGVASHGVAQRLAALRGVVWRQKRELLKIEARTTKRARARVTYQWFVFIPTLFVP